MPASLAHERGLLGVLGGMGPAATADFLSKLVRFMPADRDEQHLPVLVSSDPRLPDRTQAWLEGQEDAVLEALLLRLRQLETAGASLFVMPCNSAHHWAEQLAALSHIPMIHIADAVLSEARARFRDIGRAAILATPLTLASGFHQRRLLAEGIEPILPDPKQQGRSLDSIRQIKAGDLASGRHEFSCLADEMFSQGADIILLACTEIPLVLDEAQDPRLIDTGAALAKSVLRRMCPELAGPPPLPAVADKEKGSRGTQTGDGEVDGKTAKAASLISGP